ncbi:MAG: hypothetical protein ACOC42_00545 [Halobacteriota archaeon]
MRATLTEAIRSASRDQRLRYLAGALAYAVALLHLFHPTLGFPRLVVYLRIGQPILDPRPLLFVLSAVAIIVAVNLVWFGAPRKPMYVAGMAMMVVYLVGYVGWHFTGHGGFLPWRDPVFHEGIGPLENVVNHLAEDVWALVAVTLELALLVVLSVLVSRD